MEPESNPDEPGEAYGKALKDRIVREAQEEASAWTASADPRSRVPPRLVIGVAVMVAGVVLALDNLGFVDAGNILRYWPLALIAVGITKLVGRTSHRPGAMVWIVVGAGFLGLNLGLLSFPGVAALLLFIVGARIAWRALSPVSAPARADTAAGDFDIVQILGGTKRGLAGADFKGGQALVFMGGCEIDLRGASMAKDEAVLDVFAFWGGIEVKIPDDWEFVSRGTAILGGFADNARHAPTAKKRLVLTGMAIMGGVEVKN